MDEERRLEDFTEEEIKELEAEEAKGNKFLTVDDVANLVNFTKEELDQIQADADAAYAELEAMYGSDPDKD